MFSILFFSVMPMLAACLILYLLRPCETMRTSCYLFMASMVLPMAWGISSCIYFTQKTLFNGFPGAVVFESVTWIVIIGLVIVLKSKTRARTEINKMHSHNGQKTSILLVVGFVLIAISAVGIFIVESVHQSHGNWDAISIWNLRARFIFRGDINWAETFANHSSLFPADYPLLIPCAIARFWGYTGSETVLYPLLIAFSFMFASVAMLVSSLAIFGDRNKGLLAGSVLIGIPYFSSHSASQCADVPLGFYMLSTFVLLLFRQRLSRNTLGIVFMAGLMAGLSSWTKNEGLLFLAAVTVALLLVKKPEEKWRERWKETAVFICGTVPVMAVVLYFKLKLAPESIYVSGPSFENLIEMMFKAERHLLAAQYFAREIFSMTGVIIVVFPMALFSWGVSFEETSVNEIKRIIVTLLIVISGYYFIFIIAPYELEFNLAFSLKRLYLHLWPSVVFIFFLVCSPMIRPGSEGFSTDPYEPSIHLDSPTFIGRGFILAFFCFIGMLYALTIFGVWG